MTTPKGDEIVAVMAEALYHSLPMDVDPIILCQGDLLCATQAAIAALSAAGYAIVRQDKAVTVSGAASKEG